jgi:chromosome segregation ATPase
MLLGCTEFTKIYLQIKDNPWPFVNLFKLVQNSGMSGGEVVEILKIANEHLPRVRLEYDRVKAELNSKKSELSNTVQIYQQFVDRNIALINREDKLLLNIGELEARESVLQKTTTELQRHISELQHEYNNNLNLEITQEDFSSNDVLIPS